MATKIPSFQFYPADWRKDPGIQSLSFHDRGVWFEILCLMHESEQRGRLLLNGKAMPDEALARLLGMDKQLLVRTMDTLLEHGVASRCEETSALMNRRMVRDEYLRSIRQAAGKLGGNPSLLKQNPTTVVNQKSTTQLKQNPTPSSSSSTSVEDPLPLAGGNGAALEKNGRNPLIRALNSVGFSVKGRILPALLPPTAIRDLVKANLVEAIGGFEVSEFVGQNATFVVVKGPQGEQKIPATQLTPALIKLRSKS